MYNPTICLMLAILSLCTISCSEDALDPSFVYNLETEFDLRPTFILSPSGHQVGIAISAIDPSVCDDAQIIYSTRTSNGISVINIDDVLAPENCVTSEFTPTVVVDMVGSSSLNIPVSVLIQDAIQNSGNLFIDQHGVELSMASHVGITITNPRLNALPMNAVWGGVIDSGDNDQAASDFIAAIADLSNSNDLADGYYGHLKVEQDYCHIYTEDPVNWHHTTAILSDHTWEEFVLLAEQYEADNAGLKVGLFNSQGYIY